MSTCENCVTPKDGKAYDEARIISNARFDLKPQCICYCTTPLEAADRIQRAAASKTPIRIRSGGHHHEGMCSGTDVLLLDVSRMSQIELDSNTGLLKVGPGAKNLFIYDKLWNAHPRRVFPGGGCGDVAIGGLAQGGGWGPYGRRLGLTCDQVVSFDIVLASGEYRKNVKWTREGEPNSELFWAVRGGGGGNFGVVTEFRIQSTALGEDGMWQFTLTWKNVDDRAKVIYAFLQAFPFDKDDRLTTFCRVSVDDEGHDDPAVVIAGFYIGDRNVMEKAITTLLSDQVRAGSTLDIRPVHRLGEHAEFQPGPPSLGATCEGKPLPHKVSSCFLPPGPNTGAQSAIVQWFRDSDKTPLAHCRRYLSMHSLGGAMQTGFGRKNQSSYFWRDNPVMLQYQAWWSDASVADDCMKWVAGFRDKMRGGNYTTGSFINFPDVDLKTDRVELARQYYGDNLDRLITVKQKVDPDNVFNFPMGVPTWRG